ncbi:glycosyltransferase, partial [Bacteroidota bacterium]
VKFWIPFMGPCFGTINRIIRKNKHTRIISIIDNIIPHEKRPGDKVLANYFVKSVDGFVSMSKSVLTDLETFDKQKPKLFNPHPLYDNFGENIPKQKAKQNLKLDENINYLLFFGLIRDYKGLDLLLDAFADNRFNELPIKLLVAGEFYSNKDKYYEQVEKLNLKDKVIFTNDFVPDSQVADYFCASDIIVQPYKDATQSGVTQIAYHFEKPMLVTDVGGLAEIVPKEVGYVVQPNAKE